MGIRSQQEFIQRVKSLFYIFLSVALLLYIVFSSITIGKILYIVEHTSVWELEVDGSMIPLERTGRAKPKLVED